MDKFEVGDQVQFLYDYDAWEKTSKSSSQMLLGTVISVDEVNSLVFVFVDKSYPSPLITGKRQYRWKKNQLTHYPYRNFKRLVEEALKE